MKKALAIFAAAIAILSSAGAETLSELESKAASGDANALFALGTYYAKGETVTLTLQIPQTNGEYKEQTVDVTLG